MKSFSEMNIAPHTQQFVGNKVSILDILNEMVVIHEFKIVPSKIEKGCGLCMHLQISRDDVKHVVFTGSENLMKQIKQVPEFDFPFSATVKKKERLLYFS